MESTATEQNSTWELPGVSKVPKFMFLVFFEVTSLIGSLFTIIVLIQNVKLRSVQNILIGNTCIVCIIDCVCNMSLVTGSLIADEWPYGHFMCKVNCFFINLVAIKTMLMITALCVDRYCSVRLAYKYKDWLTSHRIRTVILYVWLQALVFSLPFLTEAVNSVYRPQLNLCTVGSGTSGVFLFVTLLVCFVIPLTTVIIVNFCNCKLTRKLRYKTSTEVADKNYTQMSTETPEVPLFGHCCSYTVTLVLLWLVLEVPFIVTSYMMQYEYIENLVPGITTAKSWEVSSTFIWMKFAFSSVFPCVTFFFKKEIWQSAKEHMLCRRHNSVLDTGSLGVVADIAARNGSSKQIDKETPSKVKVREKENLEAASSLAFNVPVLFATSKGICIEDTYRPGEFSNTMSTTNVPSLKGRALDISYPQDEYADDLYDDTSDYDSSCEIDPYSTSQPVSARPVLEVPHRPRSMSDPEINLHNATAKATYNSKDLSATSTADSGLDLSRHSGSSLGVTSKSSSNAVSDETGKSSNYR
ncbi:hypothetical protein BsWGS_01946 [Bradybaena similaris]